MVFLPSDGNRILQYMVFYTLLGTCNRPARAGSVYSRLFPPCALVEQRMMSALALKLVYTSPDTLPPLDANNCTVLTSLCLGGADSPLAALRNASRSPACGISPT